MIYKNNDFAALRERDRELAEEPVFQGASEQEPDYFGKAQAVEECASRIFRNIRNQEIADDKALFMADVLEYLLDNTNMEQVVKEYLQ